MSFLQTKCLVKVCDMVDILQLRPVSNWTHRVWTLRRFSVAAPHDTTPPGGDRPKSASLWFSVSVRVLVNSTAFRSSQLYSQKVLVCPSFNAQKCPACDSHADEMERRFRRAKRTAEVLRKTCFSSDILLPKSAYFGACVKTVVLQRTKWV